MSDKNQRSLEEPITVQFSDEPMTEPEARRLALLWNVEVAHDRLADMKNITDGCYHVVGAVSFQYDKQNNILIARGYLANTSRKSNPESAFQRLERYVAKHPEKTGGTTLEHLLQKDGCLDDASGGRFSLRFDFPYKTITDNEFLEANREIARQAYAWDVGGYYMDALRGL